MFFYYYYLVTKDEIIYLGQSSDDDRKAHLNTFSKGFTIGFYDIGRKSENLEI